MRLSVNKQRSVIGKMCEPILVVTKLPSRQSCLSWCKLHRTGPISPPTVTSRRFPLVVPLTLTLVCFLLAIEVQSAPRTAQQAQGQQQQQQIVFPTASSYSGHNHNSAQEKRPQGAHNQQRQLKAASHHIYVNPQPSTLSSRYRADNNNYHPGNRVHPMAGLQTLQPHQSQQLAASEERSQVAEWPFFKSLQTIRNNQLSNQQQALPLRESSPQNPLDQLETTQSGSAPAATVSPAPQHTEGSHQVEASALTTPSPPSTLATTATPQSSVPTTSLPIETTTPSNVVPNEASINEEAEGSVKDSNEGGNEPSSSTPTALTSTTTTTSSPLTQTQRPRGQLLQDQFLLSPKMHSTIQSAVNRLVALSGSGKQTNAESNPSTRPTGSGNNTLNVMRMNGNSKPLKSSLSLNVLLKNFGALNLTSMDQILLKSSMNGLSPSSNPNLEFRPPNVPVEEPKPAKILESGRQQHQALEIRAIHEREEINPHSARGSTQDDASQQGGLASTTTVVPAISPSMATSTATPDGRDSSQTSAECKIEYSMKNVNISLANDDQSDYTCDYIIDRKMAARQGANSLLDQRICKLRLRSDFFANESATNGTGESSSWAENEPAACGGQTYLLIGHLRFCHISFANNAAENSAAHKSPQASLDRLFNFPVEREAFDMKLVHRSVAQGRLAGAPIGSVNGEIHIEIKPVAEESPGSGCGKGPATMNSPTQSYEPASAVQPQDMPPNTRVEPAIEYFTDSNLISGNSDSGTTSRSPSLQPQSTHDALENVIPIQNGIPTQSRQRKFVVIKNGPEHQLHAINGLQHHRSQQQQSGLAKLESQMPPPLPQSARSAGQLQRLALESGPEMRVNAHLMRSKNVAQMPASGGSEKQTNFTAKAEPPDPLARRCASCPADSVYATSSGQITTPNYPNNYSVGCHCRHIIERMSKLHCKLLLHFRDFELSAPDTNCSSDYLQIGDTHYCNKYAMVGHKMYLNFSDAFNADQNGASGSASLEAIALSFVSNSLASGARGFLIKYQQLPCGISVETAAQSDSDSYRTSWKPSNRLEDSHEDRQTAAAHKLQTLAPPIQAPDFGLALRRSGGNNVTVLVAKAEMQDSDKLKSKLTTEAAKSSKQKMVDPTGNQAAGSLLLVESPSTTTTTTLALGRREYDRSGQLFGSEGNFNFPANNPETETSTDRRSRLVAQRASISCNEFYNDLQFLLTSHNYPNEYGNNLACTYFISRNNSKVCYLQLTFLRFNLEADQDCRYDYLEVNNVRLCGSLKQETTRIYLFEEANFKLIRFNTDSSGSKGGFVIKAEQLECASDGSILRQTKPMELAEGPAGGDLVTRVNGSNSALLFEYDTILNRRPTSQNGSLDLLPPNEIQKQASDSLLGGPGPNNVPITTSDRDSTLEPIQLQNSTRRNAGSRRYDFEFEQSTTAAPLVIATAGMSQCDDLLHGRELTIRSPLWPESYANDELLSSCKYTILRHNLNSIFAPAHQKGQQNVCQLELRFVHLRLGPNDCLDIDGMEILCGFNAKNLVKYYPFGARQTHFTITFTTASGTAKLFAARAASPPYQHQLAPPGATHLKLNILHHQNNGRPQHLQYQSGAERHQNHSDLLPTMRGPLRFMILVRQLECIDDFLSPSVDLEQTSGGSGFVNATNLLYNSALERGTLERRPANLGPIRPRFVNRTSLALETNRARANETQLNYDKPPLSSSRSSSGQLEPLSRPNSSSGKASQASTSNSSLAGSKSGPSTSSPSSAGVLMYSFAGSVTPTPTSLLPISSSACLVQFNQYNGIFASSNVIRSHSEAGLKQPAECEIRLKLLPGFCKVQLSFGEFDLFPARSQASSSLCLGEYLELAGVQYCGQELKNASRILSTSLPSQRHISLRAAQTSNSSFRAVFRQLECEPRPISGPEQPLAATRTANSSREGQPGHAQMQTPPSAVDFREIIVRDEFFELDSVKISKFPSQVPHYDANMFIVHKIKRARPNICKLRLIFYRFDLEPAQPIGGCKRDFLDINNQDRLCGSMDFRQGESSREYAWPADRDFQISFVSDSSDERTGYHIFCQQVQCVEGGPRADEAPNETKSNEHQGQQQEQRPRQTQNLGHGHAKDDEANGSGPRTVAKKFPSNCSRIVDGLQFELTSPNWPNQYDAVGACHFIIRRARPDICSVTLNVNSMILDVGPKRPATGTGDLNIGSLEDSEGVCSAQATLDDEDFLDFDGGRVRLCGLLMRPKLLKFDFAPNSSSAVASSLGRQQFIMVKFVSNNAGGFGFHIVGKQNACGKQNELSTTSSPNQRPETDSSDNSGGSQRDLISYDDGPPPKATSESSLHFEHDNNNNQLQQRQGTHPNQARGEERADQSSSEGATQFGGKQDNVSQGASLHGSDADIKGTSLRNESSGRKSAEKCNRLLTGQFNLVESENFPDLYANDADCLYAIRKLNQSVCAIDLTFNYFDLEPAEPGEQARCQSDYLEVDYARFCGLYPPGYRLRFNYFSEELDKILRFRTDSSRTRSGFSIMVSQVMGEGECQRSRAPSTTQLSPPAQAQTTRQSGESKKSEPAKPAKQALPSRGSERELINYLPDSPSSTLAVGPVNGDPKHPLRVPPTGAVDAHSSTKPANANEAPSSSDSLSNQPSATLCQFNYQSERLLLVSPLYSEQASTYENNLNCKYTIAAASYDICALKLTLLDLDLENSQDCLNDYLLIDNRRYCGRQQFGEDELNSNNSNSSEGENGRVVRSSLELNFDANLPREIDILFHTDAHQNAGRGFKILAEQVACTRQPTEAALVGVSDQPISMGQTDQEFRIQLGAGDEARALNAQSISQARQIRRMRFGNLNYPKNYVSEPMPSTSSIQSLSLTESSQTKQQDGQSVPLGAGRLVGTPTNRLQTGLEPSSLRASRFERLKGADSFQESVARGGDEFKLSRGVVVAPVSQSPPGQGEGLDGTLERIRSESAQIS